MTPPAVFLNEGAKSYVDALAAIEAFEEKVRSVCRDVYEKYRPQLVSKVGLEDEDCEDYDGEFDRANRYAESGFFRSLRAGVKRFMSTSDGMAPRMSRPRFRHASISSSQLRAIGTATQSCFERFRPSNSATMLRIHTFGRQES